MVTFEQFYNQTVPQIINVINLQATEINNQRLLIYGLYAIIGLFGIIYIFSRFIRVERRRR